MLRIRELGVTVGNNSIRTGPSKESWAFRSILAQGEDNRTPRKSYLGGETLSSYSREYATEGTSGLSPENADIPGLRVNLVNQGPR
jgi:hypothetical protein